jgi:adenylate kinase family enzyme
MIIQVIGLPGSGKTSFSKELSERINAIHLNADEVRKDLNSDLGFSKEDRVEQSRRMGALSRLLSSQDQIVIADFVCPTFETRKAFGKPDIFVWVDRIKESRFEDTNTMWESPLSWDMKIEFGETVEDSVYKFIEYFGFTDWKKPTTLMLGRYQPWHEGHDALHSEAEKRTKQVVVGVRSTFNTSIKDPMSFDQVKEGIHKFRDDAFIMKMPNITNIVYGRDVGYFIEKVELPEHIQAISATEKRKQMGL